MELHGVVHGGSIVLDDAASLPAEGTRVIVGIEPVTPAVVSFPESEAESGSTAQTFGERYARFRGAVTDLPADLAAQHDHYRLGTPKR